MGVASIFGAASNKAPPPPLPPDPVLPPPPSASGRSQDKSRNDVNVDVGGTRAKDKARKATATTAASAKKGGSSLRTSKSSGINII